MCKLVVKWCRVFPCRLSDVPLGFVGGVGSVVVKVVEALSWEHGHGFGRVASLLVAPPCQRSLVHKYPPKLAA